MPATHALRDAWFVSFLPLLVPDIVASKFKGDWNLAAQKHMQRLDWVKTVEELWSTVNSLPKVHQLGVGSTYIFSRNDKDPSFETFPNGARVVVNLFRAAATELGVETILAAVLGESLAREATDDKAVCDVIRISARPNREHNDTLRVEVWLNDQSYSSAVSAALKKALQARDIGSTLFSITDSPFDTAKSPVTTTATSKGAASPTVAAEPPAPSADSTQKNTAAASSAAEKNTGGTDHASSQLEPSTHADQPAQTASDAVTTVPNAASTHNAAPEESTAPSRESAANNPSEEERPAEEDTAQNEAADEPDDETAVVKTVSE